MQWETQSWCRYSSGKHRWFRIEPLLANMAWNKTFDEAATLRMRGGFQAKPVLVVFCEIIFRQDRIWKLQNSNEAAHWLIWIVYGFEKRYLLPPTRNMYISKLYWSYYYYTFHMSTGMHCFPFIEGPPFLIYIYNDIHSSFTNTSFSIICFIYYTINRKMPVTLARSILYVFFYYIIKEETLTCAACLL